MANLQTMLDDILHNFAVPVSKSKTLSCLNSFVKFLQSSKAPRTWRKDLHGYTFPEIVLCLRVCLVHEATVIRIGALRVLRYLVNCESELATCNALGFPFLIARSLDIVLNNSGERLQAIRFCQKIMSFESGAKLFPVPLLRALLAIAFDGIHDHDKIHHAALAVLCQLVISAPALFLQCGGVRVMLQNLLVHTSPLMAEAVLSGLLQLLNKPETRRVADLCLLPLVAPFTDHHYRFGHEHRRHGSRHSSHGRRHAAEDREQGYACSKLTIGIILRSWNGITHLCQPHLPDGTCELEALIASLYIEQLEVRKTILDLICELVGLRFPQWTDEMSVALGQAGGGGGLEQETPAAWKLHGGFVAEEALAVLPHLASVTPNMRANHMALLVYAFASKGLLDALVEVIVTSDTFISVRATMLLGEFLSLIDRLLPVECYDPSRCIPSLVQYATWPPKQLKSQALQIGGAGGKDSVHMKQHRAIESITVLSAVRKRAAGTGPSAYSPFLQAQVTFAGYAPPKPSSSHAYAQGQGQTAEFIDRLGELQLNRLLGRDIEAAPTKLLKECGILASKDPMAWQWETVCTLFRWCPTVLRRVEDSSWRLFLRRLVDFYKPSSNLFGRLSVNADGARLYIRVGACLVEFLAEQVQNFCGTLLLDELLFDIASQVDDVITHVLNPYEANWNPSRLESTLSQAYFILVGVLTRNQRAIKCLEKCELLPRLLRIVSSGDLRCEHYAKLIIGSLNYADEYCRRILSAALGSPQEPVRDYATRFLRVLVRLKPPEFSKWGLEFAVARLRDESPTVVRLALAVLEEAVHDKMYLESLIALRPPLASPALGDRGRLVQVTFLGLPSGVKLLQEHNSLRSEVEAWKLHFNQRYVEIVEAALRDCLSNLRRGPDGKYPRRASTHDEADAAAARSSDVYLPSHLYGQLAQHKAGLELLLELGQVSLLLRVVKQRACGTDNAIRELKAALWALAHMSTSVDAFPIVEEVLGSMAKLARKCPVLSVRQTVYHALCLVASTGAGAEALRRLGWHAMPRTHHDTYPIWRYEAGNGCGPLLQWDTVGIVTASEMAELDMELDAISVGKGSIYSKAESESEATSMAVAVGSDADAGAGLPAAASASSAMETSYVLEEEPEEGLGVGGALLEEDEESVGVGGTPKTQSIGGAAAAVPPRRNSTTTSITTTRSLNMEGIPEVPGGVGVGSPSYATRSVIRKPVIRMPVLSDPDLYPPHPSPQGRLSLRELKVGSLDRHTFISPAELFSESKLVRANTSMTSLSTPSFRTGRGRGDEEAKGPCYMGLCLPRDLDMVFGVEDDEMREREEEDDPEVAMETGVLQDLHTPGTCLQCLPTGVTPAPVNPPSAAEEEEIPLEAVEALTTPQGPTASVVVLTGAGTQAKQASVKRGPVRLEILRLVSNLISCVGAKANEQALLRLKAQFPASFQNLCTYSEVCALMSRYNMRAALRRFVQELFFDLGWGWFAAVAGVCVGGSGGAFAGAEEPDATTPRQGHGGGPWMQRSISEEGHPDGVVEQESMDSLEAMLSADGDFIDLK